MARRGSYAKGIAKREEILETALEVIAKNGYRRTSVRELADAVGLSQAGLLHYFSSKEELFAEVLRKRDEVDARVYAAEGERPFDALLKIVDHNTQVPGLVQLFAQLSTEAASPDHPVHEYFKDRTAEFLEIFEEAVRDGQAAGELRGDIEPRQVGLMLIALADGLQTQWLMDSEVDMTAHLGAFLALIRATDAPQ